MRRALPFAVFLLIVALAWWFWPHAGTNREPLQKKQNSPAVAARSEAEAKTPAAPSAAPRYDPATFERDFPIAAPLNRPGSTIARDLETLTHLFDAWRSNFPREGNPIGENNEITAALTGDNSLCLALLPKDHPSINSRGELCDRWGTPFRFHQLSGQRMEIRSAGPDRTFATADDAEWTPP